MHYETLETEKYYIEATQKRIDAIHKRKAKQSFRTLLFGILAIVTVIFVTKQFPNWIPEIVAFVEAHTSRWV